LKALRALAGRRDLQSITFGYERLAAREFAGAPAIVIIKHGNPCGCGNNGCMEKHASATALEAMAKLVSLGDNLSAKDVFDLAREGNELARHCFRSMGTALGIGLASLINIFGQDHLADADDAFLAKEHVLGSAKSYSFRSELYRLGGVSRSICISSDFKGSDFVSPCHNSGKIACQSCFLGR